MSIQLCVYWIRGIYFLENHHITNATRLLSIFKNIYDILTDIYKSNLRLNLSTLCNLEA